MLDNQNIDSDIQLAWRTLHNKEFSKESIKKQDIMNSILTTSNSSITKLKGRLKIRIVVLLSGILICPVLLLIPNMLVPYIFLTLFQILFVLPLIIKYKQMDDILDHSTDVKASLKKNISIIKFAMNYERISYLFLVPFGLFFMWLIMQVAGEADFIKVTVETPSDYFKFSLYLFALLPICFIMLEIHFKFLYKEQLKRLEHNMTRMDSLEE